MSPSPMPKAKEKAQPKADTAHGNESNGEEEWELVSRPRFSPEEEANLLDESNEKKTKANKLFASSKFEGAISKYEEAAAICPHYLDYELAVLKSNVAACHLKLEQYEDAVKSATEALESLKRSEKVVEEELELAEKETRRKKKEQREEDEPEEEIISAGARNSGPAIVQEEPQDPAQAAAEKKREDIRRIRAKALMRRGRARSELGGWSNLSGAEEDYKTLSNMKNLSGADEKVVREQLRRLPTRIKEAQEKEMAEMWGKLKNLGNGILKPFGLSTDNFKMEKDEKTGGYSMSFNQNP
ncbi:hypothetical protein F5Y17DRAFT_152694 [Xylariaceae sp. FL0594]|nr:hypothetical protein F5Y17DRAFT_152694 [Xylariaceae sp. FL0594]